jgi:hypothetical protein
MFAGSIALKKGGDMNNDIVGLFMFFSFLIIGTTEVFPAPIVDPGTQNQTSASKTPHRCFSRPNRRRCGNCMRCVKRRNQFRALPKTHADAGTFNKGYFAIAAGSPRRRVFSTTCGWPFARRL